MRASLRNPIWNNAIKMMAFRESLLPSFHTEKLSPLNKHWHHDMHVTVVFSWLQHPGICRR